MINKLMNIIKVIKKFHKMTIWLIFVGLVMMTVPQVYSQMTWTPIFVGGDSQVDFWTQSETGCACSFNSSSKECACCVLSGGCSCGIAMPKRCGQCGLEKYCTNMCNITLDSKELLARSNRGFGQIKSPSTEGPTECTYRFIPDTGQRVELQIYRLVSIGRHNGKACEGGWLQLEGGARVCGSNARFDRPVVLFSDKPEATLRMQISENTTRSQFLAYFSFASKASTSVGWPVKGGKAVENTDCDWVYEDCINNDCILASPAYPGLYPPNVRCRYLIKTNASVSITIVFSSVLLSYNQCTNDYIAVYAGPSTTSTLLKTLCSNEKTTVINPGPELLVEFKSGPEVPPFNYNGFIAKITISPITTEAPSTSTSTTTTLTIPTSPLTVENTVEIARGAKDPMSNSIRSSSQDFDDLRKDQSISTNCDGDIDGDKYRQGHHDTRQKIKSSNCHFILRGRLFDTVHVLLASYNLSAPSCKSIIEIYDGAVENGNSNSNIKPVKKICSPAQKIERENDRTERYIEPEHYSSAGRDMTVVLRRTTTKPTDEDFMDVSYYFHDAREEGTLKPSSACDVDYYGLSSPKEGWVAHPISRLFTLEGTVKCKHHFKPASNQSVILTIESDVKRSNAPCETLCGDSGCRCVSEEPLDNNDHLQVVTELGHIITCLCGDYQNWLPLRIRSWTPLYIEWSRSSRSGLGFKAAYKFAEDTYCGDHSTTKPEGIFRAGDLTTNGIPSLNQYYQQKCTWILDSVTDRQLTIEVESYQDRPCTAWNLTIHELKKTGDSIGQRLYTFCSRDRHKNFTLPWKMNTAIVRLQALGRTAPQYVMKWRSDTVLANTRKSGPSPAPNSVAISNSSFTKHFCLAGILKLVLLPLVLYYNL
ncbi:uncharacterized protein LOC122851614 [Aphidius gifuensis]|nr:uncharacterized protein LOC122851614 [Aphidius gifuensis]XP_044006899.1 uncharacterized protein LOC122851614 [Aphidius gifuensis]XP_044006900.1 uncharacterized protein LOC122851614 [Aphidius gifuensis]